MASDLEWLKESDHLFREASEDERAIVVPASVYARLIEIAIRAERVAFETSENEPGSPDWHLINDLRNEVANLITSHNEVKAK